MNGNVPVLPCPLALVWAPDLAKSKFLSAHTFRPRSENVPDVGDGRALRAAHSYRACATMSNCMMRGNTNAWNETKYHRLAPVRQTIDSKLSSRYEFNPSTQTHLATHSKPSSSLRHGPPPTPPHNSHKTHNSHLQKCQPTITPVTLSSQAERNP